MQLRKLDISTYEALVKDVNSAPLFVLNVSAGNVLFNVTEQNGKAVPIKIPMTWIPLDLTTWATKDAFIGSPDFKRLLSRGYLVIVDHNPSEALRKAKGYLGEAEFTKDPDYQEEYQDVFGTPDSVSGGVEDDESVTIGNGMVNKSTQQQEHEASDLALSIVARESTNEEPKHILKAFRNKLNQFDERDLVYISNNSTNSRIKELAANRLSGMRGENQ